MFIIEVRTLNRILYSINVDPTEFLRFVCLVANKTEQIKLGPVYFANQFGFEQGLKDAHLVAIDSINKIMFEALLNENRIVYSVHKLTEEYNMFCNKKSDDNIYLPLDSSCMQEPDSQIIFEFEVSHIIQGTGTQQIFNEREIARKDKFIILIHSNEKCKHHIPHVHVKYEKIHYCVISLVDLSQIEPIQKQNAISRQAVEFIKPNLQKAREEWNRCSNLLKFDSIDGIYQSTYSKSPQQTK